MKHPAYHLRLNKAAERLAFIEAIRLLERLNEGGLDDYTYYGLGGPYLEDFRLLYEFFPQIGMVSFEEEDETYKRQEFHLPSSKVQLKKSDIGSFISNYDPGDMKSIFWLDYTGLEYAHFVEFKELLRRVAEESMVKITLLCDPKDYSGARDKVSRMQSAEKFRQEFRKVMPRTSTALPRFQQEFAGFLQEMLQVAVEQALSPVATELTFIPVSSFYYSDGVGMFTLTGVVCARSQRNVVEQAFRGWRFANLDWQPPQLINVPVLSTKERLHLQHLLPSDSTSGTTLLQALGYRIHNNDQMTEAAFRQYAIFHRYSPYLLRGVP